MNFLWHKRGLALVGLAYLVACFSIQFCAAFDLILGVFRSIHVLIDTPLWPAKAQPLSFDRVLGCTVCTFQEAV